MNKNFNHFRWINFMFHKIFSNNIHVVERIHVVEHLHFILMTCINTSFQLYIKWDFWWNSKLWCVEKYKLFLHIASKTYSTFIFNFNNLLRFISSKLLQFSGPHSHYSCSISIFRFLTSHPRPLHIATSFQFPSPNQKHN